MIVIEQYNYKDNQDGLIARVDDDRSVTVYPNRDSFWIEILNGQKKFSFVVGADTAVALRNVLAAILENAP